MRCPTLAELPPPPESRTVWPWTRDAPALSETMPNGAPWPRLSIVTASRNQAGFLEEAIRSVLLQGYPNLEFIVVDGASTDGSVAILQRYDPWLTHWVSEPDGGPARALNKGFARATGDILGFLNADDFYLPGCLRRIAEAFQVRPKADVISGHGYFAKPSGELGMPTFSDRWSLARFRYGACVLVQQATFFKREMFERVRGFKYATETCWDMELWADMAAAGASFRTVDEFLGAFRLHAGSITGSSGLRQQRLNDARLVMEQMRGRREAPRDRYLAILHRLRKFSGHPRRTVRQRFFFYSTLKRWQL